MGASDNEIGGDSTLGEGNVISGNDLHGILIKDSDTNNNSVTGNLIGTDVNGTLALGNGEHGILITSSPNNTIGGTATGETNVISGNAGDGIFIEGGDSSDTIVHGNHIGTNLAGITDIANGGDGIFIDSNASNISIGGSAANQGNLISGNTSFGISTENTVGLKIQGNQIGTDLPGVNAIANSGGISLGVNTTSTTIGVGMGDTPQAGNVISGNDLDGILVDTDATNNLIFGNLIGLSLGGMAALGNSGHGVIINGSNTVVGGSNANQRNFIGANSGNGILVAGTGTGSRILGNSIGITTAGNSAGNTCLLYTSPSPRDS